MTDNITYVSTIDNLVKRCLDLMEIYKTGIVDKDPLDNLLLEFEGLRTLIDETNPTLFKMFKIQDYYNFATPRIHDETLYYNVVMAQRVKQDLEHYSRVLKIHITSVPNKTTFSKNEVFIVHGHDETAKTKMARFIEQLGLKPIILHEQASGSKTIIEKIETYSNVGFGIVLYTACDIGAKAEENSNYKNRARQNVVFEHGFLIGKIGRENVCALVKDEIETPNDISGVLYIKMDNEDAWHFKVARELKNSGYEIDMNKL